MKRIVEFNDQVLLLTNSSAEFSQRGILGWLMLLININNLTMTFLQKWKLLKISIFYFLQCTKLENP